MKTEDKKLKYIKKYNKQQYIHSIYLNKKTDMDILCYRDKIKESGWSWRGYVLKLIREDMKRKGFKTND